MTWTTSQKDRVQVGNRSDDNDNKVTVGGSYWRGEA